MYHPAVDIDPTSITGWWCNNHLEKYEFVNGVGIIPYIMKNKKCSKAPTR